MAKKIMVMVGIIVLVFLTYVSIYISKMMILKKIKSSTIDNGEDVMIILLVTKMVLLSVDNEMDGTIEISIYIGLSRNS